MNNICDGVPRRAIIVSRDHKQSLVTRDKFSARLKLAKFGGAAGAAVAGGDVGKAAYRGAAIGAAMGAVSGAFKANGIVRQQQAQRIANLKAALGTSREAMMSGTRGMQAGESGAAGQIGRDMRSAGTFGWSDVYGDISMRLNAQLNSTQPVFSPSGVNMVAGMDANRILTEHIPQAILDVVPISRPYTIPGAVAIEIMKDWVWPAEISKEQDIQ